MSFYQYLPQCENKAAWDFTHLLFGNSHNYPVIETLKIQVITIEGSKSVIEGKKKRRKKHIAIEMSRARS